MKLQSVLWILLSFFLLPISGFSHGTIDATSQWVAVRTPNKEARSKLVNLGVSIENVIDDMSYGFAPSHIVAKIEKAGLKLESTMPAKNFSALDFPAEDSAYRNYGEQMASMSDLQERDPKLVKVFSIGKSLEGKNMWAIRINGDAEDGTQVSGKPGIVFMGGHHAREHLSVEMPLLLADYLVTNYGKDPVITNLVNTRDIFIIPNVNPDGSEFDIGTGDYQMWRKNRNRNGNAKKQCMGVDLNRNYSYGWGTGGSSKDPCSDIYMGPQAFSEPETQAIKKFVESRPNLKVLLSFHTYSELILYPWGGSYEPIKNAQDASAFKTMAQTMAKWNGYTPEQASELYIASGDTTDWAYGTLGVFAFTFELSPSQWGNGGFYPGTGAIQTTFQANLKPALYLIDLADDPHRSVTRPETTLFFGR